MSSQTPDYEIHFTNSAAREFRSLPSDIERRVGEAVDSLQQTPRPTGVRKLRGHTELNRVRSGSHRVVYEIDDSIRRILDTKIRHRSDVYR